LEQGGNIRRIVLKILIKVMPRLFGPGHQICIYHDNLYLCFKKVIPQSCSGDFIMERVLKFLTDAQAFYLATTDENSQHHVRPFGSAAVPKNTGK